MSLRGYQKKPTTTDKPTPPKPAVNTFLSCGHTYSPPCGPDIRNTHVTYDAEFRYYKEPSLCMDCSLTHYQNRTKLMTEQANAKRNKEFDTLITANSHIKNDKDRNEIILAQKTRIANEISLNCDVDVLLLWKGYMNVWQGSMRWSKDKKEKEYLSVNLLRDGFGVRVEHVWRKANGKEVGRFLHGSIKSKEK